MQNINLTVQSKTGDLTPTKEPVKKMALLFNESTRSLCIWWLNSKYFNKIWDENITQELLKTALTLTKRKGKMSMIVQNKREPLLKAPSVSKEVALNCGIASRSNPTYLPFLSLMNFCTNMVQRYVNMIN